MEDLQHAGAVVVSYHPDADVIEDLKLLREQLRCVVVVDNGSTAASLQLLRDAQEQVGFSLIANPENMGIATALNQGALFLRDKGCQFVFLFDQDSSITPGYVETMTQCFADALKTRLLAILVPRYVDRRFGSVLEPPTGHGGHLEAATTSGSLMPIEIFGRAGLFADELFIDGVDYEYSLRVRRFGYTIEECKQAVLLHSPGTPTHHAFFGGKRFQAANYSALRRYYQERNKIWVAKRYARQFPLFCAKQFFISAKDFLKIWLVESDKWRKTRFFFNGILDGLRGRTGKLIQA